MSPPLRAGIREGEEPGRFRSGGDRVLFVKNFFQKLRKIWHYKSAREGSGVTVIHNHRRTGGRKLNPSPERVTALGT